MNKHISKKILTVAVILSSAFLFQSCDTVNKIFGKGGKKGGGSVEDPLAGIKDGQLIAKTRKGYKQVAPEGMVLIPSGSFLMGQADEDVMSTRINLNKRISIPAFYMDDTEISNHEYRMFVNSILADSLEVLGEEFIMTSLYPDTTVWKKDFTYHNGDQLTENYYGNPAFDNYPVVGVSWKAAQFFCQWRSNLYNNYRAENNEFRSPRFRLPSEAEWEWAARGGSEGAKYPWGNPYVANAKGCYMANFKPNRGNYQKDGFQYTAPVNMYEKNAFGLYNMAGNVSEWTQDAYSESYMPVTWDLNPNYDNPDEPRKVIKGGSWKDVAHYLESGTTTYEYETATKSYLGFRCVMDRMGSVPGRE